ncbi:MAG: DUF4491 family protein [Deltaproteobacteria bacterium]|jgi:hypothetical protein|nr:DUF4491 family protein [Deltaproteobacteria bacterium]
MSFHGLIVGVISLLVIGVFHPIVIKGEYYFTDRIWPLFLAAGLASLIASCFVGSPVAASALGILGFTFLWSIHEIKEQTGRVEKGWFPRNPKRARPSAPGE